MTALRGAARVAAATTGLLLIYGIVFALEGMTTRLPITPARELLVTSVWTAPWMLLFCSGLEDLAATARRDSIFWIGVSLALLFLYYFDRYTSMSVLTNAVMPPIAVSAGLIPHFVGKVRFLYFLSSIAAGLAGAFVLAWSAGVLLSATTHFATSFIGIEIATFSLASIIAGVITVFDTVKYNIRQRNSWR